MADASIRIDTEIQTKQAERELKSLESSIVKTADKIASLRSKMDALKDAKIPTQEYQEIATQIEKAEQRFDKLLEKQKQIQRDGKDSGTAWQRLNDQIADTDKEIALARGELKDLVDTGKAFTLGIDTEKYAEMSAQMEKLNQQMQSDTERQKELQDALAEREQHLTDIKSNATVIDQNIIDLLERRKQLISEISDMEQAGVGLGYKQYEDANIELEKVNEKIREYKSNLTDIPKRFESMNKSAKKAFDAITTGTKQSNASLSSGLKTILKYGFGIRSLYVLFNKIRSGIQSGFTNLMGYSDSFANSIQNMKNSMSTLGNQIAAAFAPIVQMVIPWLTKLISAISTAMTYVAQFIAILGGKSTFTRAKQVQDSYNKSLGKTAKAADKARGALARFDDLDVLEKKEEDTGIDDMAASMGDLFEEVPVDSKFKDWLDSILEKLKPILDYLKKLKDIFMQGFWDGLGDWEYRWEIIKNSIASIKESLKDIFTDPAVLSAADAWAQSVAYMLGSLVGSMASIGLTIAANLLGGISKYLEQNKDRIKNYLVDMFNVWAEINYILADFFQSFAYVFEAFASESGQQLTANIIGIFTDAFMGVTELVSKLARDLLEIIILPFVENKDELRTALEGFLSVLADATGTIKQGIDDTFDKLNDVYDKHFKPFFDSIANGLSQLLGHFLEFWNGNVQPILQQWADWFDMLWTSHIQPFIDNFIELFGALADLLTAFWENILKPLIDWTIDHVLPIVLSVINEIMMYATAFVVFIADAANLIINAIKSIVVWLTDVFTGEWRLGWDSIISINTEFIEKFKETGKNLIEGLIEGIKEKWENLKAQVSEIGTSILDTLKNVLSIHSPSKKTEEMGEYTIDGYIIGLENKASHVSDIWTMIKEQTISILQSLGGWISNFGLNISDKFISTLQSIQEQFTQAWTAIYENTIETWTLIQEYFTEFWTLFIEYLIETWEEILLIFTENFEEIQLLFEEFITFLNEIFLVSWLEAWTMAGEQYQTFHDLITMLTKALQDMLTLFVKKIQELINTIWKQTWKAGEETFVEFANRVEEVVGEVRSVLEEFFGWCLSMIQSILSGIASIASAASNISFGGFSAGGGAAAPAMATFSAQNFAALTADLPHLASGSVIRGGNPFMAILGDQRAGQTNIEAPAGLIKDMVAQGIAEAGIAREPVPVNININWDGETFARVSISDILSELARQGYDVSILGVT